MLDPESTQLVNISQLLDKMGYRWAPVAFVLRPAVDENGECFRARIQKNQGGEY